MISIMQRCNDQKLACRKVSEGCERVFFCMYLKHNIITTKAIVVELSTLEVLLYSPEFSFDKKLRFKECTSIIKKTLAQNDK
jgi:hypothetical protein